MLAEELRARARGCPDAEALARFAAGEAGAAEREALSKHVAGCAACAAALSFLSEDETAEPADLPRDVLRRSDEWIEAVARPRGQVSWMRFALRSAALVAVAAGLAVIVVPNLRRSDDADLGTLRGESPLEPVSPVGAVAGPPRELRWVPYPGAAAYHVEMLGVDLEPLWSRRTRDADAVLALDESERRVLTPPGRYWWRVQALDAVGRVLEGSPMVSIEITPSGG
jgi:hypothetical protein